jgi:hypothetical protein
MNEPVVDAGVKNDLTNGVKENLLGLSYAMFDTLYGTKAFDPLPFCQFLVKCGEHALAEEIALAAVEKSCGEARAVHFVLYDLVPNSVLPDDLVQRLTDSLIQSIEEGKQVLIAWQRENGNTEAAFKAALRISDRSERFRAAVPLLEDKPERRKLLKETCPTLCGPNVIGVFSDTDWPQFLLSVKIVDISFGRHYNAFAPGVYIDYAANKMKVEDGKIVAVKVLKSEMTSALRLDAIGTPPSALAIKSKTVQQWQPNLEQERLHLL